MCLYVETLRVENGDIAGIEWHQKRLNNTLLQCFGAHDATALSLAQALSHIQCPQQGLHKLRVEYNRHGITHIDISPYKRKKPQSFKLVVDNNINYSHKSVDRSELERNLALKEDCDEIIIVKNGLLTDTSYSNIALFNGTEWHTPARPLLQGTMRARLMAQGLIVPQDITVARLPQYSLIAIINAMNGLGENTALASNIR